jgi:hypothetical protein
MMKSLWLLAAAALLAGCAGTPLLSGTMGGPSLDALQQMCGAQTQDYRDDAQPVHSTLLDAYIASRRGALTKDDYCTFQTSLAQHYAALGAANDARARGQWAEFFNEQRVRALSWRASVDPTLR